MAASYDLFWPRYSVCYPYIVSVLPHVTYSACELKQAGAFFEKTEAGQSRIPHLNLIYEYMAHQAAAVLT
jgi:hypothetical protein